MHYDHQVIIFVSFQPYTVRSVSTSVVRWFHNLAFNRTARAVHAEMTHLDKDTNRLTLQVRVTNVFHADDNTIRGAHNSKRTRRYFAVRITVDKNDEQAEQPDRRRPEPAERIPDRKPGNDK